ncbi:MAG: VanW family protein [Acetatifactor sp.]
MKRYFLKRCCLMLSAVFMLWWGITAEAKDEDTVKPGIYAGEISLSGMTAVQAEKAITEYVGNLKNTDITFLVAGNHEVTIKAGDLGLTWTNPELVAEALEIGTRGNVIERYKVLKNLEYENKVYPITLALDLQKIREFLKNECEKYNVEPVDYSLVRYDGEFHIIEGTVGYVLDIEASVQQINDCLSAGWDGKPCTVTLEVAVIEPGGSAEELSQVKDLLGSFTTSYASSGKSRSANVENGCELIDGFVLYPGEEFSAYDAVAPFTEENGYYMAGSYLDGKVVDSLGGGICQVSTTLYNAVLKSELEVTERHNHSMIVSYVDPSADAAISESSGKDFRFVNNLDTPVYIEGYTVNKKITFNIYGKELRDTGRTVHYESEVLEVVKPSADVIYEDPARPVGYLVPQSAHTGYKARLWKVVEEDGRETSRTIINNSSYKMVPGSAVVGTATADPAAYAQLKSAIDSGSLEKVRGVIAALTAAPGAPK